MSRHDKPLSELSWRRAMLEMIRSNLRRRAGRTGLTAVGVAVGVTTVVALLAVTTGLARSAGDLARLGQADFGVFQSGLADLTASSLPESALSRIESQPGVAAVAPIQIVARAIPADPSVLLFGAGTPSFLTRRLVLVSGTAPRGAQLFAGVGAAQRLHLRPGDRLVVSGRALEVAGIYRSGISLEDAGVVLPLAITQQLSGKPGELSMVAVSVAPGYGNRQVEAEIEHAVPGTLALSDPSEVARVDTNSRIITKAGTIITILALLLGAVVVINTMAMAVIERRREFGVLTAIGWSRRRIGGLILGEMLAISLAGAAAGLGLGALASDLVVRALGAGPFVSPVVSPWVLGRGLLVGLALGVAGTLFCVWQVMRLPLLAAINRA
ncbi:MAG TPA: ABC transporter permease [Solirubrobacteraceae bacterium]|nr:ABC transporter permease [Solirubrobacteraceae bacterium]